MVAAWAWGWLSVAVAVARRSYLRCWGGQVARRYAPPAPPDAPPPPNLCQPGVLEQLASEAGLKAGSAFDLSYAFEYRDEQTLGRLLLAPMGLAKLAGPEREDTLRSEIVKALAPYRAPDGSYRFNNQFRYLIARAWQRSSPPPNHAARSSRIAREWDTLPAPPPIVRRRPRPMQRTRRCS